LVEIGPEDNVTILWNQQVRTDRTIDNNKPDIIIRDDKQETCILTEVVITGDRNVIKRGAEKILKKITSSVYDCTVEDVELTFWSRNFTFKF